MTPYKTNKANILYNARQNNISNNNFQIADTFTHCVSIFIHELKPKLNKLIPHFYYLFGIVSM